MVQVFEPQLSPRYPIFGNGSDGALHVASGTTTIGADKQYTSVLIDAGANLVVQGVAIRCQGAFTPAWARLAQCLPAGATISRPRPPSLARYKARSARSSV